MSIARLAPMILLLGLGGCGAIGAIGVPGFSGGRAEAPPPPQPASLPAPIQPVQTTQLPPLQGTGAAAMQPGGAQIASTDPMGGAAGTGPAGPSPVATPANAAEIGRTDLLGGWTISSGAESCQLFMTLTSWTGGYRASTRGCNTEPLKSISAWQLNGREVVLAGETGSPVARLYGSGGGRFNGTTEGQSQPVSFFR